MRRSEQYGATWENIDWSRNVLFVAKSKNREPRDVYLNSYVIAILRALQTEKTRNGIPPTGRIFGIKSPRGWFEDTIRFAQIQGVSWNTLRHHFATHLVSVGVPIKHVQDLLGHLDPESTARYIHPADTDIMEDIAKIAGPGTPEYLINKAYNATVSQSERVAPRTSKEEIPDAIEPCPFDARSDDCTLPTMRLSQISREELYELVWSQPVIQVAKLLGRSDVAVAKSCRKRNIPLPGRGRWAKIAAGKPVSSRPPLPPL
jgi:hypothetical protein